MAITITHLTSLYDPADLTAYVTASISPTANRWLVVDAMTSDSVLPGELTVTGLSGGTTLTWTNELTHLNNSSIRRVTRAYAWTGASPGSGTLNLDFTVSGTGNQTGCAYIVYEMDGVDLSDPFVQSVGNGGAAATSVTVTLAAFASGDNRPLILGYSGANEAIDADTSPSAYTEIAPTDLTGASPNCGMNTAWLSSTTDTTPSYSWTTSVATYVAIASEIKAAAVAATTVLDPMGMRGFFGA